MSIEIYVVKHDQRILMDFFPQIDGGFEIRYHGVRAEIFFTDVIPEMLSRLRSE